VTIIEKVSLLNFLRSFILSRYTSLFWYRKQIPETQ